MASTSRCQELRHLAQTAMHSAAPAVTAKPAAGMHLGAVHHQSSWQGGQSADDVPATQLAPRLLAALQAQLSVWQRVKVALLSHFAGRLRAQLAEERARATAAAKEAEQRAVTLQCRLQDVQKVSLTRCTRQCTG